MQTQLSPYLLPLIVCAVTSAGLTIYAFRQRQAPAGGAVTALMVEVTLWLTFHTLEIRNGSAMDAQYWARLAYLVMICIPPTWLVFSIQYTRNGRKVNPLLLAALFLVPAVSVAFAASDTQYHQFWSGNAWNGIYSSLPARFWFWFHLVFSYIVLAVAYGLLGYKAYKSSQPHRTRLITVLLSGLAPLVINAGYIFVPGEAASPNPFPLLFALCSLVCGVILLRYRVLDITPVAHDLVVKNLSDGLVTLDSGYRIIEINPAAEHILGLSASAAAGRAGSEMLGEWFDRAVVHPRKSSNPEEVTLGKGVDQRQYDVLVAPLIDRRGDNTGTLVILRDITRRKRMESAERDQRLLAEALRDTSAALNSTLEITEVLDSILANVERVVPHRAASIMLIEAGVARVARGRGYRELGIWDFMKNLKFRVSEMTNLRWMVETSQPYVINDTTDAQDWVSFPETAWIRSNVCAPIIVKGKVSGFINLDSDIAGFFSPVHAERLQAFANQSAIALENARLYRELQQLASTDELTTLFNRRRFFELGHSEVERSRRFGHPLSLMILDADHFKRINDSYGHIVGDQVLSGLARRCRSTLRNIDIVARYGGDEFIFLLLESDEATALPVAQRILEAITGTPFNTDSGPVNLTVSMGLAQLNEHTSDLTSLIKHADQALYRAKQTGRNMLCVWEYRAGVEQTSNPASSTKPIQRPFGL